MEILALQMDVKAVLWLALSPHSKEVRGSNPALAGASQCGVSMFSLCLCGLFLRRKSQLPTTDKDMHVRLIGDSKLAAGVNS